MTVRYLGMNGQTGLSISEVEHIRQSVRDILVTPVGSRVMRREYGSLLSQMIDQPQTPALRLQIMAACYSAIQKWEPRVNLSTITFERSETDGGLYVDITGTRSTGGQLFSLTIPLS
ncbi:GPW/gp25 family protein [Enterobacter kobei]|uniref:GPW/gp25 family protein n=1 Tax=Enterobacter kobei TaxID=208224 RepID=UPI0020210559|nr:GPW/gp25 family protein [Enterobacter kobei]MCL8167720.1 GPW/gp25 family protein [Enterobacter kobei]MCM7793583.1 GPW/gp25 family protein [Enterobacter kobei]HCR1855324.1 GPW/gp25 family protein [Enterobacter kobei]HCR2148879.1 GPW/gp25 family protein [Enterobacter kobei]HDR2584018.1 GPW/gp25 family protein [Enterobacter kobei]